MRGDPASLERAILCLEGQRWKLELGRDRRLISSLKILEGRGQPWHVTPGDDHLGFRGIPHTQTIIYISITFIYNCIYAETAKLSSCDRDHIACKPKVFIIWLIKKKFANSSLKE